MRVVLIFSSNYEQENLLPKSKTINFFLCSVSCNICYYLTDSVLYRLTLFSQANNFGKKKPLWKTLSTPKSPSALISWSPFVNLTITWSYSYINADLQLLKTWKTNNDAHCFLLLAFCNTFSVHIIKYFKPMRLICRFVSLCPHRGRGSAAWVSLGDAGEQIILTSPLGCAAAVPVVIAG